MEKLYFGFDSKIWTIWVTILLAIVGYLFRYFYELGVKRNDNYLNLVNDRLEHFYGPLYILSEVGRTSYQAFLKECNKENDSDLNEPLSEAEKTIWINWVVNVFHKNNLEIEKIIINKAYLIMEEAFPKCLHDFVTHIASNKALLKKWEGGNYEQLFSLIDYPAEFHDYAQSSYLFLKHEQLRYIKAKQPA